MAFGWRLDTDLSTGALKVAVGRIQVELTAGLQFCEDLLRDFL